MSVGEIQIFEQDDLSILFRKKDFSVVLLPLKEVNSRVSWNELSVGGNAEFQRLLHKEIVGNSLHSEYDLIHPSTGTPCDPHPVLDRLTLSISNVCNLGCSYCYASMGTYYNMNGLMMTKETALNAINWAVRVYSRIEHINFFGGEPTLNRDIIEVVCEYVRYLHTQGILAYVPSFGITTNGYAIDDRMLEILTGYGFTVTLSLDGPKKIHDLKRPTKSGKGSYEAVMHNAKRFLDRGLNVEFECTYTADHLRLGFEITSLMDFFHDEFGCRILHCPVVSASPDNPEFIPFDVCSRLQGDAIEYSILNLVRGIPKAVSIAVRILNSLIDKIPIWNYCPAGQSEITVNADGNVYACFMLMQCDAYSFGNVNGSQIEPKPKIPLNILDQVSSVGKEKEKIKRFIADADKYANESCQKCWAQLLCYGCLGEDFERYKGCVIRSEIPGASASCDYMRSLVERFLRSIASAYRISLEQSSNTPLPRQDTPLELLSQAIKNHRQCGR
ncbi:sulfatase maturation enzyme AslB [Candidatus Brocadia pituitae]|nr:sulfatase maturation enzyme AslB [Candidatus Brocadia pituitae]